MGGDRRADALPVAIDEIEDPRGRACRMHDFREDISGERRNLGRLQHHGAAAGERRRDLAQNLAQRPVPGRDEAADADRLLDQKRGPPLFLKGIIFQRGDGDGQMAAPIGT